MGIFGNGLLTGLVLQLAIGPVFFFIVNLTLQKTVFDGMAGVLAVTIVDYLYISLSILGIGKLLENKRNKKLFGIIGSLALVIFGAFIIKNAFGDRSVTAVSAGDSEVISSFLKVFLLTISSPLTIIFFTSLFTAKASEYNYTKKQLIIFGFGTGFATLSFMGGAVLTASLFKTALPTYLVQKLNIMVGLLLIGYGMIRLNKIWYQR